MQRDRQKVQFAKQFNLQKNYFGNNYERKEEEVAQIEPIILAELYAELRENNELMSDVEKVS